MIDDLAMSKIKELDKLIKEELPNLIKYRDKIIYIYDNIDVFDDLDEKKDIYYVSKRQSINLAKKFLADVDFSYYQLFKEQKILMMNKEEINNKQEELFDLEIEDEVLDNKIDEFCDVLREVDEIGSHIMLVNDIHKINILVENNIADVFSLVHEFTHIASNSVDSRIEITIYNEVQPILSEMILKDYLIDMGADREVIDNVTNWREFFACSNECYVVLRILEALDNGEEISSSNLCIDDELFDKVIEELREDDAVDRYMEVLEADEMACSHILGYYYAKLLYLAIPKEMRLAMLKELNELRKNSSDIEYAKYIENIIGDTKELNVKDIDNTIKNVVPNLLKYKKLLYEVYASKREFQYNEPYYISKRQSLALAREFLYKIGYDYLSLFNKQDILMLTDDEIINLLDRLENGDFDNSYLQERLNKLLEWGNNTDLDTKDISIIVYNNINDSAALVHEFMHLISGSMSSNNDDVFEEIQSNFGELVFFDFLIDKGMKRVDGNYILADIENIHYDLEDNIYALKFLDLYNSGKDIDFDNYDDKFRSIAWIIENGYKIRLKVNDASLPYALGYYYASKLYEAIPKEERLAMLRELNDVKRTSSDIEYMDYVVDIINGTKDKSRKVKVRR